MSLREELVPLEAVMWRAPSAHNTQPWVLTAVDDDRVALHWDPARELVVTDATRRDLYLSLGAFVAAAHISAAEAGIAIRFDAAVDPEALRGGHFVRSTAVTTSAFTASDVVGRSTGRMAYRRAALDAGVRDVMARAAALGRLVFARGADVRPLVVQADGAQFADRAATAELRRWLRLNPREQRYAQDGLTAAALDLGRIDTVGLRALLSHSGRRVLAAAPPVAHVAARASTPPMHDDDLVAVHLVDDPSPGPERLIDAGSALLHVWLHGYRGGLVTHPLSQVIDVDATADQLRTIVGATDDESVVAIYRLGVGTHTPARAPRLVS